MCAAHEQSASDAAADEQSYGAVAVQQPGDAALDDDDEPADARAYGGVTCPEQCIVFSE